MKFASVVKTGLFKGPVDFLLIDQFLIEKKLKEQCLGFSDP